MKWNNSVLAVLLGVAAALAAAPGYCQATTGGTTGASTGGTTGASTGGTTGATTGSATAGTTTGYTSKLSANPVLHTVANHYIAVTEGESGTQEIDYRGGGSTQVDLKGKWSVVATAGDPFHLSGVGTDVTDLASDALTGQPGGSSNYMVALIDAPRVLPGGVIPGTGVQTTQDTSANGTTTGTTGGTNGGGTTVGTTGTATGGTTNAGTTTGTTTAGTTTTGTTGEHAIVVGTGGFNTFGRLLGPQFPTEHQNSRTISSVWIDPSSNVAIISFLTLERDTVRVQYTAYNEDTLPHSVGLKLVIQPSLVQSPDILAFLQNPVGTAFTLGYIYVPGQGLQMNQARYDRPNIPDQWLAYDGLPGYTIGSRMIMAGQGATPPDHLLFGQGRFTDCCTTDYVSAVDSAQTIRDPIEINAAAAEIWDPQTLQPGGMRTIVQYYGLAGASEDFSAPFVLATEAPATLSFNEIPSASSTTSTGQQAITADYGQNPIPIKGFVYNTSGFRPDSNPIRLLRELDVPGQTMTGAESTIILPGGSGLTLSGAESATEGPEQVPNEEEGQFSWDVMSDHTVVGPTTYAITGGGAPLGSKTVYNKIELPALPDFLYLSPGWSMVTFPFEQDPTRGTAYQLSQLLSLLSTQGAFLVRWNPTTQSYDTFTSGVPDSFLNDAVPGESYWVYLPPNGGTAPQQIQLGSPATPPLPAPLLVGGVTPGSTTTAALASVPIERGWNQIGDPYVYSIAYSDIQVQYGNTQISLPQAVAQGIIATPVLWYWVHNSASAAGGQYKALLPGQNSELIPYQGYWIDSNFNGVTLVFNAPAIPGAQLVLTPPNGSGGDGGTIITR